MADWQTPKTDWQASGIPGAGDFNRIEGNIQWLKEDAARGSYFIMPSDAVIMTANAERTVATTRDDDNYSAPNSAVVKKFRLKYDGIYRVTFELRTSNTNVRASALGQSVMGRSYKLCTTETYLQAGIFELILRVAPESVDISGVAYIRNVAIRGSLLRQSDAPNNAVLLD